MKTSSGAGVNSVLSSGRAAKTNARIGNSELHLRSRRCDPLAPSPSPLGSQRPLGGADPCVPLI